MPQALLEGRTPSPDSAVRLVVVSPVFPEPVYVHAPPVAPPAKDYEWWRMFFHVVSIAFAGLLCQLIVAPLWRAYLLMPALALAAGYELMRPYVAAWQKTVLMREHEKVTRTASTDFLIAMALAFLLFAPQHLAPAIYITALADPAARLIGKRFGKRRWPGSKKTFLGSSACFAVAAAIMVVFDPGNWRSAMLVGLVTLLAELLPQHVIQTRQGKVITPADNLSVLLAAALAMSLTTLAPLAV